MTSLKYDTVIVGGGIAGLTAAAYLSRAGRSVLLVEKQPKVGGLVQTFDRNGVFFDTGLRSIEDSGIVFPMLRQLGIKIDFVKSNVSIGIGDSILKLKGHESLNQYEDFLKLHFPDNKEDITRIIIEIRKIMDYVDILYGIDNPIFMNMMEDKKYLVKVILPWMFNFIFTIRKMARLNEPVEDYLRRFTTSQPLIDNIAQHFFQKTPTSFALSYFRLYLDYHYPKGGTGTLIDKMAAFVTDHGGEIKTSVIVESLNPEGKYIIDNQGNTIGYTNLIWAADQKLLYNCIPVDQLKSKKLIKSIEEKRAELKDLRGGDSVLTLYLTVRESKEYFSELCTGHFFYTPVKTGLSSCRKEDIAGFLKGTERDPDSSDLKNRVKKYLTDFCELNTFEISIPVLRDPDMAPAGQTGLIVSLLFDYQLTKRIDEMGWTEEIREFLELTFIRVLDGSIFPGLREKITDRFSSSPLTLNRLTGNTDGGITGWAFTNPRIPAENQMLKVYSSVVTPIPSVYQAGQWVFSPSGLPISILTGKLAADKAL
jgi:phytoene dehydrogenase-like protein